MEACSDSVPAVQRAVSIESLGQADAELIASLYPQDADRWRAEKAWAWRLKGREWAVGARRGDELLGFVAASPMNLCMKGQTVPAARIGGGGLGFATADPELNSQLLGALVERLREAPDVDLLFSAVTDEHVDMYGEHGFQWLFEVFARNLYVGLEKVSARLSKAALDPVRRFATKARRLRPKLTEMPLDEARLAEITELTRQDSGGFDLALVKDAEYMRWRFLEDPRAKYRVMTYRAKKGQGITSYALVRRFEPEGGRPILHVDDYWTRRDSRRDFAKLLGEIALVGLSEECDAVRCAAAAGSAYEQTLISVSCIRKKIDRHFMVLRLDDSLSIPEPFPTQGVRLAASDLSLYAT